MLVLANGAFKSGSSWLLAIVKELAPFEEVPLRYRSPFHKEAWIDNAKLEEFLQSGCYRDTNIITKGHYYGMRARHQLLRHDGVYVLDIERDIKDSIVSHYYHVNRLRKLEWPFERYYWRLGRYKVAQILAYHATWRDPAPNLYVSSYESLKQDFEGEVGRIGAFLGMDLTPEAIAQAKERTTLATMQKARGQDKLPEHKRFFRKGVVGEWRDHFSDETLADLERIETDGLGPLGTGFYHLIFDVRPSLAGAYRRALLPVAGAKKI